MEAQKANNLVIDMDQAAVEKERLEEQGKAQVVAV